MQTVQKVFAFTDPIDYLRYRFEERRRKNSKFSLSAWARQLGYENSSLLSQVLKRERSLKMNLVCKLGDDLKLKGKALKYFECIVLNQASKTDSEKKMYQTLVRQMRPKKFRQFDNLPLEIFSAVADWYHWAILEMLHLEDFREDLDYMHRRLGGKVTKKTLKLAIERLLQLGLIARDSSGVLVRADANAENSIFMRNKIPSAAVQSYHRQMIEEAKASVADQDLSERYLRGTTIPMKKANLEKAAEILRQAHKQLLELSEKSGADEVYQLNSQFFKLTRKVGAKGKAVETSLSARGSESLQMVRNLTIGIALLGGALVVSLYGWNSAWLELADTKLALAKKTAEVAQQKVDLQSKDSENESLRDRVSKDENQLQKLTQIQQQQARPEVKQPAEPARPNASLTSDALAKIRGIKSKIQSYEQQDRAIQQEIAGIQVDAKAARSGLKRGGGYGLREANDRIRGAQMAIQQLRAARASMPRGRDVSLTDRERIQDLDAKIVSAQTQLNYLKAAAKQVRADQVGKSHGLEAQIRGSLEGLRFKQKELRQTIEAEKAELKKELEKLKSL